MDERKEGCFSWDVVREGEDNVLRVNCDQCTFFPSPEDNPLVMSKTIELLSKNPGISRIVFYQKRDYEYDYEQTTIFAEIAKMQLHLAKGGFSAYKVFGMNARADQRYAELQNIIHNTMKSDPVSAFVELKRMHRRETLLLEGIGAEDAGQQQNYAALLESFIRLIEGTKLIKLAKPHLAGYRPGDRSVYREIFRAMTKPDFMFTKLMAAFPPEGEEVDSYMVKNAEVAIFKVPDNIKLLYHITPPEFKLSEDKYELLDAARSIISEHKPQRSEFVDPERLRQVFSNVGSDLIEELASFRGIKLRNSEVNELARILVRHTIGFGMIEVLLNDQKVQDITINSPMGSTPIFLVHQDYDDCFTNIIPTQNEGESWASKLRLLSGRPLDEANPILDTELAIPDARARVGVISPPLNPTGLAYAFRRHRDKPWTLPLFIKNSMISPLGAGLLSFLVDGSRTLLIAGTRSAGKTSLLGAVMTEIMRKYRLITIEDTLELPVSALRNLGYNIQSMKVASAMTRGTNEVPADEGIRTTLRLGDSGLIVGEVRSTEAKALYEAMRIGALANVVAGTIHGDSPYGVYDRVVNDLGVPKTSFKATDIIVVTNPIRSADGLHRVRRVTQITEVGKFWEQDPLLEKGFRDLMKYDTLTDSLEPTTDLLNGESDVLKSVAGSVKEWSRSWDSVWDNILLRTRLKETLVAYSRAYSIPELLEAESVIQANDEFHRISDSVMEEIGYLDNERIFFGWNEWLKSSIKKAGIVNKNGQD
ncbi:type II/IV secretion system ATPase subunit [Candidatus Woesearchaeota archaeon]|nr:type II/IV secretion system ATPase subunit [Candidatus Woesearchaeota archaeon]